MPASALLRLPMLLSAMLSKFSSDSLSRERKLAFSLFLHRDVDAL